MINIDLTAVIQLINFLVSLAFLNYLLIKPIREIIGKRNKTMSSLLEEAEGFASKAETKMADYEKALAAARAAGADERIKLKGEASAAEKQLLEAAQQEASVALKAAREDVKAQTQTAMDSLRGQVDGLAQKAVAKILA